mmetsp:Transcript_74611/g.242344  ORF Transcript_74611/g.242344 Transcript_74611/m.242344 type:complete len:201 (+) Transcript_74611:723-1325(+)
MPGTPRVAAALHGEVQISSVVVLEKLLEPFSAVLSGLARQLRLLHELPEHQHALDLRRQIFGLLGIANDAPADAAPDGALGSRPLGMPRSSPECGQGRHHLAVQQLPRHSSSGLHEHAVPPPRRLPIGLYLCRDAHLADDLGEELLPRRPLLRVRRRGHLPEDRCPPTRSRGAHARWHGLGVEPVVGASVRRRRGPRRAL